MGDEISGGFLVDREERTPDDLYDLIEKVEDLKLQDKEDDAETSFFVSLSERVQAIQDLAENEMKGYNRHYIIKFCRVVFHFQATLSPEFDLRLCRL
jgi:hypothetical protein